MTAMLHLPRGAIVGDDFRVLAPLGAGGMGAVYVAEQLSTGKHRALKVMHQLLMESSRQQERFVQEARVGARIESDHVVEVIAAGVDEVTGVPWIAMELLDGEDLEALVSRRGALSPRQVHDVFQQLCHALGAAHAAGIVHRDVKPQNVFVAIAHTPRAPTSVKVLDFGIAKVAAGTQATATAMVGSPAWMAPEQTDPQAHIMPTTDVWALGLLAFWLLTGRAYWKTADDPQASMRALMKEILFDPLVPASERAAEYERAQLLPAGFDDWFCRCVDREPAKRFADATEAGGALARIVGAHDLPEVAPAEDARRGPGLGDLVVMSTRSFIESADLEVVPTATQAASESSDLPTAAFIESADLKVGATPSDEGRDEPPEAATADADRRPSASSVQATAVTPAGLSRSLYGPGDDTAAPARAAQAAGRRGGGPTRTGRYVVSAVAGAAIVVAALWMARDEEEEGAARQGAAESPAASARPKGSSTMAPASRQPSAAVVGDPPKWASGPFAGADPKRFDASAYMKAAQAAARKSLPDAELMMFTTHGVDHDGLNDLTRPGRNAIWSFRSPGSRECISVVVTSAGAVVHPLNSASCVMPPVRLPTCSTARVVKQAMLGGSVQVLTAEEATLTYTRGPEEDKTPFWAFHLGTFSNRRIVDECPVE